MKEPLADEKSCAQTSASPGGVERSARKNEIQWRGCKLGAGSRSAASFSPLTFTSAHELPAAFPHLPRELPSLFPRLPRELSSSFPRTPRAIPSSFPRPSASSPQTSLSLLPRNRPLASKFFKQFILIDINLMPVAIHRLKAYNVAIFL
jgi:hypothetical protein